MWRWSEIWAAVVQEQAHTSLSCTSSNPLCISKNTSQKESSAKAEKAQGLWRKGNQCPAAGLCSGWSLPSLIGDCLPVQHNGSAQLLSSSNGCKRALGQALEAVSTQGFMVSSGRLGEGCVWDRVAPGESSRGIVQPCCSGPASPFPAYAGWMPWSRKHQSSLLSHTSIPLPPSMHALNLHWSRIPPLYSSLGLPIQVAFPSLDPRG